MQQLHLFFSPSATTQPKTRSSSCDSSCKKINTSTIHLCDSSSHSHACGLYKSPNLGEEDMHFVLYEENHSNQVSEFLIPFS
jgi:hypothetical protein